MFDKMIKKMKPLTPKKMAVAHAQDDTVLGAVMRAYNEGFIVPILCGDKIEIEKIAKTQKLDISKFEIIQTNSPAQSALVAVNLVREKKADILMKGLIPTADLLKAVLNKETGIRGNGILSHVSALYSPTSNKTLILTDVGMVMYPDLKTKVELVKNAVAFANSLGIAMPKVAPICAVEVVNPDMPATLDASALAMMNMRGQIKNCIIDGPLAFDVAISMDAVKHKGLKSEVAGNADILLFPNIESANATLKALTHFGGLIFGGLIAGATNPIIINSRGDNEQSKFYSIAIASSLKI